MSMHFSNIEPDSGQAEHSNKRIGSSHRDIYPETIAIAVIVVATLANSLRILFF
ncbi:hypothetical protein ACFFF7_05925 [Novosphingobium aquiterrae]|uniref:Uncharacterized protein n=1 Tax=Novosphingobium aquiterrae TaxID=624388 RepID=A0ABV6PGJ2_9SPHN